MFPVEDPAGYYVYTPFTTHIQDVIDNWPLENLDEIIRRLIDFYAYRDNPTVCINNICVLAELEMDCDDQVDNNNDGLTDCEDRWCWATSKCKFNDPATCIELGDLPTKNKYFCPNGFNCVDGECVYEGCEFMARTEEQAEIEADMIDLNWGLTVGLGEDSSYCMNVPSAQGPSDGTCCDVPPISPCLNTAQIECVNNGTTPEDDTEDPSDDYIFINGGLSAMTCIDAHGGIGGGGDGYRCVSKEGYGNAGEGCCEWSSP
jgi:hypothetical protein